MRVRAGSFRPSTQALLFVFVGVVLSAGACAPTAALIDRANPRPVRALLASTAPGTAAGAITHGTAAGRASSSRAAPQYRYIYDSGSASGAVVSNGWNLIDVGSKWSADQLPVRAKGLVWVGDYDNSTCSWEVTDAELKAQVAAAIGDPKVFGYLFSDEPNPYACPSAPAQHRARSDLIHSVDPRTRTVVVLDSNGFRGRATRDSLDQLPLWKGTADVIGLDPYPCYQGSPCDFTWIDKTIHAADASGLNYWGVVQAFNASSWRWPTPSELSHMLDQWAASRETGYMTFAWAWAGSRLASKPDLLGIFRRFNAGASAPPCVVPNVVRATLAVARTAISGANCLVGTVSRRYSPVSRGRVIAQDPKPRTRLAWGGRVTLVISKGRRP